MPRQWPMELDSISSLTGKNVNLVQGPGGNTSWKKYDRLWVKASGTKLSEANLHEIFCEVSVSSPYKNLNNDNLRPSIEAQLHAVVEAQFVVHVHSVGSIAFGIKKNPISTAKELLDSYKLKVLEYKRPGISLAESVLEVNRKFADISGLILRNHGIVLWGDDIEEIYNRLLSIEDSLSQVLPVKEEVFSKIRELGLERYIEGSFLTPDHAVFGDQMANSASRIRSPWLSDLDLALCTSLSMIKDKTDVDFLSEIEVDYLVNWELEKARMKLNLP